MYVHDATGDTITCPRHKGNELHVLTISAPRPRRVLSLFYKFGRPKMTKLEHLCTYIFNFEDLCDKFGSGRGCCRSLHALFWLQSLQVLAS